MIQCFNAIEEDIEDIQSEEQMSQNDPLLGSDWLEKEETIGGQSLHPLNGIPFSSLQTINGKSEPINGKTVLNYPTTDPTLGVNKLSHNSNRLPQNRLKDSSHQQLMSAIAMSSSDSSTDDIVIPMQRRKVKTRFPRKRWLFCLFFVWICGHFRRDLIPNSLGNWFVAKIISFLVLFQSICCHF